MITGSAARIWDYLCQPENTRAFKFARNLGRAGAPLCGHDYLDAKREALDQLYKIADQGRQGTRSPYRLVFDMSIFASGLHCCNRQHNRPSATNPRPSLIERSGSAASTIFTAADAYPVSARTPTRAIVAHPSNLLRGVAREVRWF
jgi:hypothetical protein